MEFSLHLLLLLLAAVSMTISTKIPHKRLCPSKRFLREMDFDESLLEAGDLAENIERLCGAEVPTVGDPERPYRKQRLLKGIEQLLRLNITRRVVENEPRLRRSCRVDAFATRALRKLHKCFGLTTFPRLPSSAKRLRRTKPGRAADMLMQFLISSYSHWYAVHEHSKERSRRVWNENVELEEDVGRELWILLEGGIRYAKGVGGPERAAACGVSKRAPSKVFLSILYGGEREMSDCLKLTLFHKIEDEMTIARDLLTAMDERVRSGGHRRRSHRNKKHKAKKPKAR
ncbi:hypothetical protein LSH36_856g01022 [Paralvinella palmiformis]|uniref:Uncharacterized protein n=1 Tax=Paralvinella palmiformis TaxID=53620 RepID=A0AAD9IYK0_9ANNE|nr:hypothetical protein LSH36_856g01022 [Paralvinella palmiformis]